MKNSIHSTAIIDKKAKLGNHNNIGPYSIIGPNVEIKNNVKIHSNVNIQGYTLIDEDTEIFPFASIGTIPQDLKYHPSIKLIYYFLLVMKNVKKN